MDSMLELKISPSRHIAQMTWKMSVVYWMCDYREVYVC